MAENKTDGVDPIHAERYRQIMAKFAAVNEELVALRLEIKTAGEDFQRGIRRGFNEATAEGAERGKR